MTVTVSARLTVRLRHAEMQEAKKEVLKVARVKSWAPAAISLSINCDAAASSCVVLDKERQTQSRRNHSMKFNLFATKIVQFAIWHRCILLHTKGCSAPAKLLTFYHMIYACYSHVYVSWTPQISYYLHRHDARGEGCGGRPVCTLRTIWSREQCTMHRWAGEHLPRRMEPSFQQQPNHVHSLPVGRI